MGARKCRHLSTREQIRHPSTQRIELGVIVAGDDQHWNLNLLELIPQWLLRAGAARPQAGRQPSRPIGPPFVETRRAWCEAGEQWISQPLIQKGWETDLGQPLSQAFVGLDSGPSIGFVVEPRGRSDQHKACDELRSGQGSMQRYSAPHRITHIDPFAAGIGQQFAGLDKIGVIMSLRGVAMAREVDQSKLMVSGEVAGERTPTSGVLGEAVG